jgi:hypothetical protein
MKLLTLFTLSAAVFSLVACSKDEPVANTHSLPNTYNFENIDISGQATRLDMLSEIVDYMKTGNAGASISATQLQAMYENNYTWNNAALNGSTKQLANKLADGEGPFFGDLFNQVEAISNSTQPGSNGTPGLVTSGSGTRTYMMNAEGLEPLQMIEKGTMGALMTYQITQVYLGTDKMNVDNTTVTPGKGTDMQHHWDEAFGYWGVPNNYGTSGFTFEKGSAYDRFWGEYCNGRDPFIQSNSRLMKAFIKGRDAINRKDYDARDAAITEIRGVFSEIAAATAIHYFNAALNNFGDDALRNHTLTEGLGFLYGLQFNPAKKVSTTDIEATLSTCSNLYTISAATITQERDALAAAYGWSGIKESL